LYLAPAINLKQAILVYLAALSAYCLQVFTTRGSGASVTAATLIKIKAAAPQAPLLHQQHQSQALARPKQQQQQQQPLSNRQIQQQQLAVVQQSGDRPSALAEDPLLLCWHCSRC
jgi:N-acetylmuramoyl-L-alanine amidase